MGKPKKEYLPYEEASILWECDFPSRPELLESLLKARIEAKLEKDRLAELEKTLNTSLMAFFDNNRIPGVYYNGYVVSKKTGAQVTINREALILAGVKAEVIDACMKRTPWESVECREDKKSS